MSHPFTAAWSDTEEAMTDEKGLVMNQQDVHGFQKPNISLVVRRRTGFTNSLFERAEAGRITLPAYVEGPYGNEHALDSYGTVVLFSAGVGITHNVPYVRHLVQGFADGTVAARRVTLVWVLQSPEHLEWIRPWMTSILAMERRREVLRIVLFITRPRNTREIHSPSATVQMFPGKPDISTLLDVEVENQVGAMGVMVCGTGSLSDDVRLACRQRQTKSTIDFVEECFTW
jgi:ferredoxin-NADP reductase